MPRAEAPSCAVQERAQKAYAEALERSISLAIRQKVISGLGGGFGNLVISSRCFPFSAVAPLAPRTLRPLVLGCAFGAFVAGIPPLSVISPSAPSALSVF